MFEVTLKCLNKSKLYRIILVKMMILEIENVYVMIHRMSVKALLSQSLLFFLPEITLFALTFL